MSTLVLMMLFGYFLILALGLVLWAALTMNAAGPTAPLGERRRDATEPTGADPAGAPRGRRVSLVESRGGLRNAAKGPRSAAPGSAADSDATSGGVSNDEVRGLRARERAKARAQALVDAERARHPRHGERVAPDPGPDAAAERTDEQAPGRPIEPAPPPRRAPYRPPSALQRAVPIAADSNRSAGDGDGTGDRTSDRAHADAADEADDDIRRRRGTNAFDRFLKSDDHGF